jgi:uncharacterized protein (DUF2236 family)
MVAGTRRLYGQAGKAASGLRSIMAGSNVSTDMPAPFDTLRSAIARQVIGLFNDASRQERPVQRRPDGLFGPQSAAWAVHGDVTTMMVGGIASLLLQMLHPAVLAGVWDHSAFRNDMIGRLRRTARFIALTTYGGRDEAQAAIARVRAIHAQVKGVTAGGAPYRADDPDLLAWVHVTESTSFLAAYVRHAAPGLSGAMQDRYFAEMAQVAEALGADPVPRSRIAAARLIATMRPALHYDERTTEVAQLILQPPPSSPAIAPAMALTIRAAIDLLPPWARTMHGLEPSGAAAPLVRAGTTGLSRMLRWALA